MRFWLLAALLGALVCACAPVAPRTAAVHMPGSRAGDPARGSVTLVFPREVTGAVIAIDGVLIADGLRTRRLHVRGVPAGQVDIALAAEGVDSQVRVRVEPGRNTAVPIGAAPLPESGDPAVDLAVDVGGYLLGRGVSAWLF